MATAVEYGLIGALVAVVIVGAVSTVGTKLEDMGERQLAGQAARCVGASDEEASRIEKSYSSLRKMHLHEIELSRPIAVRVDAGQRCHTIGPLNSNRMAEFNITDPAYGTSSEDPRTAIKVLRVEQQRDDTLFVVSRPAKMPEAPPPGTTEVVVPLAHT